MEEAVTCKICGKGNMKRLGFHVRKVHSISMKEYEAWEPRERVNEPEIQDGATSVAADQRDRRPSRSPCLARKPKGPQFGPEAWIGHVCCI